MSAPDPTELGKLASDLLDLLDRIELEDDASLAHERFEIARSHGFQLVFQPADAGVGRMQ